MAAPVAARVVDAAFALIYLRLLSRADVGALQFVVVLTTYVDTLVDFGLNALIARDVARGTVAPRQSFRTVNQLRLGLWLVGVPLVAIVYGPLRPPDLAGDAALAGWIFFLALLPSVVAKTSTGVLWAAERLELTASVQVLATVLRVSLGAVALFSGQGVLGLAFSSLITNVVTSLVLWRLAERAAYPVADQARGANTTIADRLPSRGAVAWLREAWPLFVNLLLQGLFFKVDAILLLPLGGAAAAGAYAAAYKVAEGAGVLSSSFTLAIFPRLSRTRDLASAYRLALRILLQAALPLAAGTALLSEPIVALVGGRQYLPDAAIALAILIAYLPLSYVNGLTQYVLIAAGRQRLLTAAFVAALVFNLAANWLLIPRYTYVAAAWVTVASEVVLLIPFQRAAREVAGGVSLVAELRAPLVATLLMAPVVWWLRDAIHPIAAIVAGVGLYPIALWALGGVDAQQVRLLRQLARAA